MAKTTPKIPKMQLATKVAPQRSKMVVPKPAPPPAEPEFEESDVEFSDESDGDSVPDLVPMDVDDVPHSAEESDSDEEAYGLDPKSFVLAKGDNESEGDSDQEIQAALEAGLIDAKNAAIPQIKPSLIINKEEELKQVLFQMKSNAPWIATVDVVADEKLVFDKEPDNDFAREALFYNQAKDGATKALALLKSNGVPITRPEDYFAEMVKTDQHMQRIRKILQERKKDQEGREDARRLRTERKFAVKVQREAEKVKRTEKKKLMEAVKKHKKGMKGQLETMLKNAQGYAEDEEGDESRGPGGSGQRGGAQKKMSRTARDRKFGSGGMKRGSKRNDKDSFDMKGPSKRSFSRGGGRGGRGGGGGRGGRGGRR
uniref:rRNA-processing protein EBP2 n=1 Tax=Panagrellus redivivus TaxID=6233 RepID=A0A7E4ZUC0_PANRE